MIELSIKAMEPGDLAAKVSNDESARQDGRAQEQRPSARALGGQGTD
jgi:hypothetical protein